MSRPRQLDPAALTLRLQTQGPLSAQNMADMVGANRLQVSRALNELGSSIVRLGTRRGARYALRRSVRGLGSPFAIRRIDAMGRAHEWAELTATHGGWQVAWATPSRKPAWAGGVLGLGGWSEGFPFFLSDLRPQGYLGRMVGRKLPSSLGLPADPRDWSDDNTLVYLQAAGDDLPGDLIVGDQPLLRVQQQQMDPVTLVIPERERISRYPTLAETAIAPGRGGASVEGEQPKFLTMLDVTGRCVPVVVKFTDLLSTPTGRRWADLLAAEAHALTVLHEHGETLTAPRVFDAGDRRFLELERFDRAGAHGRRGVVSLRALHEAFSGADTTDWTVRAASLEEQELIGAETLRAICLRHNFGQLIGNSDMHFGNLAFWQDDALPFRLAPAYDMVPMLWAPVPGQALPIPEFRPVLPLPASRELWAEAAQWAEDFWARVAGDAMVSTEFRGTAHTAGELVARMRAQFSSR